MTGCTNVRQPSSKNPSESVPNEWDASRAAKEIWDKIKDKDFSIINERLTAFAEIASTLKLPALKRTSIIQKLVLLKKGDTGIIHKIALGPINREAAELLVSIMSNLATKASKKAWLEQADAGIDALVALLVRDSQGLGDDQDSLRSLLDAVAVVEPSPTLAIEKLWESIKEADFGIMDEKRAQAITILNRLANMAPGNTRAQISRALSKKDGMTNTNSGLLQSMVQGPIDAQIVKICEVLIDDQVNAAAKSAFINQKLGSLNNRALVYLTNLNISRAAPSDGPGVRISTGALLHEAPHLDNLFLLFLRNGAETKDLLAADGTTEEFTKMDLPLSRLLNKGNIDVFSNALLSGDFGQDELTPYLDWIIRKPENSVILKSILASEKIDEKKKAMMRGIAFQLAVNADIKTTVVNRNPVKVNGYFLGYGGTEYYVNAVGLKNFNRLLDYDFGLEPHTLAGNDIFVNERGSLIWMLSMQVAFNKSLPAQKRKAVIRTIAQKLKSFHTPEVWTHLVLLPTENSNETAVDVLITDLEMTRTDAVKLLHGN